MFSPFSNDFLIRPLKVTGRVLWNRVCLSFCPSALLSRCFLGSLLFSKFWHGARNLYQVVHDRARFSWKKIFPQKLGKWTKNGPKTGFFNLFYKFVITFYWSYAIMKIYIICCVPAQISYLGKFWFLRYGPKCSQPSRLQDFLINHISRWNKWNGLMFCMLIQIYLN